MSDHIHDNERHRRLKNPQVRSECNALVEHCVRVCNEAISKVCCMIHDAKDTHDQLSPTVRVLSAGIAALSSICAYCDQPIYGHASWHPFRMCLSCQRERERDRSPRVPSSGDGSSEGGGASGGSGTLTILLADPLVVTMGAAALAAFLDVEQKVQKVS